VTFVDRATRCILGWTVSRFVSDELLQEVLDGLPPARWYYSDAMPAYDDLAYETGFHFSVPDKSETYSVEGDNADLRHYLARLVRRSRCFSRSLPALRYAVRLFVFCWNQRQLYRQRYPNYPAHLFDFVSILC
jgi:insertion element IS1 protein InsB